MLESSAQSHESMGAILISCGLPELLSLTAAVPPRPLWLNKGQWIGIALLKQHLQTFLKEKMVSFLCKTLVVS